MAIQNSKLPYILIAIVSASVFLNSLHNGFVYDDIGVIEDNYFIRSLQNIPKVFSKDYFHLSRELSYRPVVTLSYFTDYAIWRLHPFGYHLTNGVLHTINSILIYTMILLLIRVRSVAFLSAIIFSIHPCVTEAVNGISYREDLFVVLFSLLSCLCLIKSGRKNLVFYEHKPTHSPLQKGRISLDNKEFPIRRAAQWDTWVYYTIALLTYLLSLFSKETAIVTPLFILVYRVLFVQEYPPPLYHSMQEGTRNCSTLLKSNGQKSTHYRRTRWASDFANYYLGYILISLFYVLIRFVVLKNPVEVPIGYLQDSVATNFMTMVKILAVYVKLMFFPFQLSADYLIVPVVSVFDIPFIISSVFLAVVGIIIFKTLKHGRETGVRDRVSGDKGLPPDLRHPIPLKGNTARRQLIYGLFMLCFFVALLPVLNIVPIGHIMADRYLYLPVAGFCIVPAGLLLRKVIPQLPDDNRRSTYQHRRSQITTLTPLPCKGEKTGVAKKLTGTYPYKNRERMLNLPLINCAFTSTLISVACIFFTTKTLLRNRDWQNEHTFWTAILREQPKNYDAHNNLGNYYYKQGHFDRAIGELEEAVRLKQHYPEGHNSLGTMYIDKGLIDKAIAEYGEAIKYKPLFPEAYYNLGNACIKKGLMDNGIAFFQKAISMGMYNPQVFNNLGGVYVKKGMLDEAIVQYQKAVSVYSDFAEAHSNLGYVYAEKGDLDNAVSELSEALRLQPNHANAHNNLGAVYCQRGLLDMAQQEFLAAVRYDQKNASAHKNIGMIYFTKGDKERAREHLAEMLKYDPNYLKDAGISAIVSQLGLIKK